MALQHSSELIILCLGSQRIHAAEIMGVDDSDAVDEVITEPEPLPELVEKYPVADAPTYPDDESEAGMSEVNETDAIPIEEKSESWNCLRCKATNDPTRKRCPSCKGWRGGVRGKSEARALKGDVCAEIGENDNADAGADSFCSNVDDSLPPAKKAKSEGNVQVDGDNSKTSRQCPKCEKVLHFRSERSAIGGYKLHVSRCKMRTKNEDYSHLKMDAFPKQKPVEKACLKNTSLYSLMEDPTSDATEIRLAIPDAVDETATTHPAFKAGEDKPESPTELVEKYPAASAPTYPDDGNDSGRLELNATDDIPIEVKSEPWDCPRCDATHNPSALSDQRIGTAGPVEIQFGAPTEIQARLIHQIIPADVDAAASRKRPPTAESQQAELAGGEKRKYKKRESEARSLKDEESAEIGENDNAIDAGTDSFCSNVDESLPPTKRTKSDDDQVGEDGDAKASRQCPKCAKVFHFRSKRSAIGGYKVHVSRCKIRTKNEDYSHVMEDAFSKQKPAKKGTDAVPRQGPAEESCQNRTLYSLTKDPISSKDMNCIRRRQVVVKSPDPRPCYGCHWCGPHQRNDVAGNKETLCPACKLLSNDGWFRWIDNIAKKVFFVDKKQKKCPSIRFFLSHTTVPLGKRLGNMSPEERAALLSNLYVTEVGAEEYEIQESPKSSCPKREQLVASSTSGRLDAEMDAMKVRVKTSKTTGIGISPPEFADAVKSKLARRFERVVGKDVVITGQYLHILAARKKFVRGLDPRPSFGCSWCGVTSKSGDETLNDWAGGVCPICESFKDFGYTSKAYTTARATRSFSTLTTTLRGVKEYLTVTTDLVAEAMQLLSALDCASLRAKYKRQGYDSECEYISRRMSVADRSALQAKNDFTITGAHKKTHNEKKKSSISATKKSTGFTPNISRSRLSKGVCGVSNDAVRPIIQLSLPTIPQLMESNLSDVLKADVFCVYNSHFGTNSNIAAKILLSLSTG